MYMGKSFWNKFIIYSSTMFIAFNLVAGTPKFLNEDNGMASSASIIAGLGSVYHFYTIEMQDAHPGGLYNYEMPNNVSIDWYNAFRYFHTVFRCGGFRFNRFERVGTVILSDEEIREFALSFNLVKC